MYKIIRANIRFIGGLTNMIEEIRTYYDEDLEEYVAETYINERYIREVYDDCGLEEMLIQKINEIIREKNSK